MSVYLPDIVGKGYADFWKSKKRYRVLKGGRASKKSRTTALWFIYNMMKYDGANTVVVRKELKTHKDSTFAVLKWATKRLECEHLWHTVASPSPEMTFKPTGQKILFRGFDDVMKLTSITVDTGDLCWVWLEETFEIANEADFQTLDECIRGEVTDGLFKQITLTYNPWINSHWTKTKFWDQEHPNTDRFTTTYHCNEWLDDDDRNLIEDAKLKDPDRYRVIGEGEYGIPGGTFFSEFRNSVHVIDPFIIPKYWDKYLAIDYGLDMLAALWIAVDTKGNVYVYKELHKPELIVSEAAEEILAFSKDDTINYAPPDLWNRRNDTGRSAIDIFRQYGLYFIKSDNNRVNGWLSVKELVKTYETRDEQTGETVITSKLKIFRNCKNLINNLPELQINERNPNDVSTIPHNITHAPDALRYFSIMRFGSSVYRDMEEEDIDDEDKIDTGGWFC